MLIQISNILTHSKLRKIKLFQFGGTVIEVFDLINPNNNQIKFRLKGHENIIYRTTFTDDSKYLISVSWDKSLRVWDLNTKKEINKFICEEMLNGVAYSSKKQLIACCGYQGQAYIFDSRTLNHLSLKVKWQAHSNQSLCIEFINNSNILMMSFKEETRFWIVDDLLNKKFKHFKEIKEGGFTVQAYPIDNPQIVINCGSDYKMIKLWNYDSTQLIQNIEIPGGLSQQCFAFTSDFGKIITGGTNERVNIFEKIQN